MRCIKDRYIILREGFAYNEGTQEEYQTRKELKECITFIGVDSFLQHLAWYIGKPGIVIWGQSDPLIFGHLENKNIIKDRKYLRENQFWLWEQCDYKDNVFVTPKEVLNFIY